MTTIETIEIEPKSDNEIRLAIYVDVIIESRNHEINSITEQKFKMFKQDQS